MWASTQVWARCGPQARGAGELPRCGITGLKTSSCGKGLVGPRYMGACVVMTQSVGSVMLSVTQYVTPLPLML